VDDLSDAILLCESGNSYTVTRFPADANVGGRLVPSVAPKAPWAQQTRYQKLGYLVGNGGEAYQLVTAGISANTGSGPAGQGSGIVDGSAVWNWVGHAATQFVIDASIQPVPGEDLDRLNELYRTKEVRWLFCKTTLQTESAEEASTPQEADQIQVDGSMWKVVSEHAWDSLGNYRKVLIARIGR